MMPQSSRNLGWIVCAWLVVACGSNGNTQNSNTGHPGVGGAPAAGAPGSCSSPNVRITEIDVGATVSQMKTRRTSSPWR